jgi:CheY-like chemotaxis protein
MDRTAPSSILVIGDDTHFCYLMQRYIRNTSHQITFAFRGDDVLEIAQREKPIAIILQLQLPGNSGWKVLQSLKSNPATQKIPVLLCSWADDEKRSLEQGADAFLRMPILYQDFLNSLSDIGIIPCV